MREAGDMQHFDFEKEIKQLLPHRFPMLLVDRVLEYQKGTYLKALKNVTINEDFFNGHFPQKAVMPGVLIIEAMAQAACLLLLKEEHIGAQANDESDARLILLAAIERARFKFPVLPGDQLILEVRLEKFKKNYAVFECGARVGEQIAASAILKCMMK